MNPEDQVEHSVFQSVPIASCSAAKHQSKEPSSTPSVFSLQVFINTEKQMPLLLQTKQSQRSQLVLIGEVLQTTEHPVGSALDSF